MAPRHHGAVSSRSALVAAVRPRALAVSDVVGRATSGARMTPSFLITGAQRCGTTSMYRALAQHPCVLGPVLRKGVHYFDTDYGRGSSWYRAHFPTRWSGALAARRGGAPAQAFESSPYYLFHPLAGERIAADLPGVRLVVLVRDPVERAYSAHTHELRRGFEHEPFDRALELEEARLAGAEERLRNNPLAVDPSHQHHAYVARGRYVEQLERLEQLLGRERLHVVDSQDFFDDPAPAHSAVLDFLGLPPSGAVAFDQHNARPRSPMPEPVRERLSEHFRPYDERLAAWLGTTPSWRR